MSHNDPNLDNVVFRDGRAVALIDFDLAGPGSRVWDVACAARLWVPLRPDADVHDARSGQTARRLRVLLDGYGLDGADRRRFLVAVVENQAWFSRLVDRYVGAGHPGFTEYSASRERMRPEAYRRWLGATEPVLRAALDP